MEIQLEARLLKQITQFADSLLVSSLPLVANADGLQITVLDSEHINAIKAKIPNYPEIFRKYVPDEIKELAEGEKARVCFHDVDIIKEVLKLVETPASTLGIKTVPSSFDEFKGQITIGALTRSYDIQQYAPNTLSDLPYVTRPNHAGMKIMQREFYNAAKTAADTSGPIKLRANKERFFMESENMDFDGKKAEAAEVIAYTAPANGFVESTFDSGYLLSLARTIPPNTTFELWISDNFPLTANFSLAGAPGSEVKYLIAPHRIRD